MSLQSTSFSAMYSDRSLDIVCADRREFEVWTTALQVGVTAASHDLIIIALGTTQWLQ